GSGQEGDADLYTLRRYGSNPPGEDARRSTHATDVLSGLCQRRTVSACLRQFLCVLERYRRKRVFPGLSLRQLKWCSNGAHWRQGNLGEREIFVDCKSEQRRENPYHSKGWRKDRLWWRPV